MSKRVVKWHSHVWQIDHMGKRRRTILSYFRIRPTQNVEGPRGGAGRDWVEVDGVRAAGRHRVGVCDSHFHNNSTSFTMAVDWLAGCQHNTPHQYFRSRLLPPAYRPTLASLYTYLYFTHRVMIDF